MALTDHGRELLAAIADPSGAAVRVCEFEIDGMRWRERYDGGVYVAEENSLRYTLALDAGGEWSLLVVGVDGLDGFYERRAWGGRSFGALGGAFWLASRYRAAARDAVGKRAAVKRVAAAIDKLYADARDVSAHIKGMSG